MRSHAKASSAGSTQRQGKSLGRFFRGALATRGGFGDAKGSGAPSFGAKLGILALSGAVLAVLVLIVAASAFASKSVFTWVGSNSFGSQGAQFSTARGVAVNSSGAGGVAAGTVYVADGFNNRIQQLSPTGAFVRAWGFDTIQSGKAGDLGNNVFEVCEVAADCKEGISSVSPAAGGEISAPQGIAVDQSTGALYVSEQGFLRIQKFSATGSFERAFGKDVVAGGATTTEVCTVASECKAGTSGEAGGELKSFFNGYLAVAPAGSPNAGNVYVADPANRRVQEFDSSGAFVDAFGADVETPAGGNAFEVCSVAANCKSGSEGTANGQFAFSSPNRVAVDDAGRIYAIDNNNSRVQRFSATPAFDTLYATTQLGGSPAPADIAIDPGATSAGDGSDDHVFVVKPNASPEERRIKELGTAADPSLIDTHMSAAGINSVNGLALNTESDRLFASSETGGNRVYFLDNPLGAPVPVANAITTKTDTTATFTGTVDPQGGNVACKFQYATDAGFIGSTDVAVPGCEALAIGGGAQAVSANVTGLLPNTTYYVRLQASRPFVSGSTVTSSVQTFATDSVPPVVTDIGAVDVEDTSARLAGTIDPRNAETSYVFEYGPTPALGSSTAPLAIGGGTTPIVVSQLITGLAKDTTYYFRLVATNAFGSTPSTQASFHTRSAPAPLPDNRAYEQVSPVDKNWGDAISSSGNIELPSPTAVGYDGEGVAFGSVNGFGDPAGEVKFVQTPYVSRRGASGWQTQPLVPSGCVNDPEYIGFFFDFPDIHSLSSNVTAATISRREAASCSSPPLDPGAILPAENLYRSDLVSGPDYDLLVPNPDPSVELIVNHPHGKYVAGSDDYGHIILTSGGQEAPGTPAGNFNKLYEWDNGTLRLVSVEPDGTPFEEGTNIAVPFAPKVLGINGGAADSANAVSASGDRIFFQAIDAGTFELYMREDGTSTYRISESECTSECGASVGKQFQWADLAGDKVALRTTEKMTNEDPTVASSGSEDLYLYTHSANPAAEGNLTLISRDQEPSDGTTGDELGVIGMSDDGNTVYFIDDNQLVAGAPTGLGPENIYRWDWNGGAPTLQYLGSAAEDAQITLENSITEERQHSERRVSRDGSALMIETSKRLLPAADSDTDHDVYLWRVGKGWSCVSCQVPGEPSSGPSTTGRMGRTTTTLSGGDEGMETELASAISAGGERVFFESEDNLVAADVNGPCAYDTEIKIYPCKDVYEWHDGRLALITPGTASTDVGLIGTSTDGRDVVFYSRQKLVGWDKDNFIDIYDARVGGGFPEPPVRPAACEGESCRGAGTQAPGGAGAGTAAFQGPGNPKPSAPKACPKGKRKVRSAGKTRCVKRHSKHKHKRARNNNRRAAR